MRFHDLRHCTATILLSMGVPAKVVQEILRHSDISTTLNIYAHVLPEMHRDAMEKMDDFLRGNRVCPVLASRRLKDASLI